MVTFKAVVYAHQRRKDGTYNVKIRVTHKGIHRHLATSIYCTAGELTRTLAIKDRELQRKCDAVLSQLRDALSRISMFEIEAHDVDWVVRELRTVIMGSRPFRLDFFEFGCEAVALRKPSTRSVYLSALGAFRRHLGRDRLDINDITYEMLLDYRDALRRAGKLSTAYQLQCLGHLYRLAQERYNDEDRGIVRIPRRPFSRLKAGGYSPQKAQKALAEDIIQRMIDFRTEDRVLRRSVDIFLLSFVLMGANLADLWEADPPEGDTWKYERVKTRDSRADRARMEVTVPPEAAPYIARLRGKRRWLDFSEKYASRGQLAHSVWLGLRRWCREQGLEPFSLYAARHSWATIARRCGVEKALVDECLAHKGDFDMADVYAERNWALMAEANRKVLDRFRW